MMIKERIRSTPRGSRTLEWWNKMDANSSVCQSEYANGDAPEITIWANRHGMESSISPK